MTILQLLIDNEAYVNFENCRGECVLYTAWNLMNGLPFQNDKIFNTILPLTDIASTKHWVRPTKSVGIWYRNAKEWLDRETVRPTKSVGIVH